MDDRHLPDAGLTMVFDEERATIRRLRKARLVVLSGPDRGQSLEIDKPRVTAGRSVINDLVLHDRAVSGFHFEIVMSDDGYCLRDLDSRNGTFVGELRIREVYLRPGTMFRLGGTQLLFQPLDEEIELTIAGGFEDVVGASAAMREIFAQLQKVAPSDLTCLITGETGTGKELIARAIHNASSRRDKPFVVLDCSAIPKELIESTLFGHEKGSFTGAIGQHKGCFEQAAGGTIFLDEIGELDISLQPKLLRVLEQREIKRVGGDRTIHVDVRVLAATNRDLRAEVNSSHFREDLYFRLSVVHLELPPLRQRPEDILRLARHFLQKVGNRREMLLSLDQSAINALLAHAWPGNVRELRNVVERAAALADSPVITGSDLVFGNEPRPPRPVHRPAPLSPASAHTAEFPIPEVVMAGISASINLDPELFRAGTEFKQAKQSVVDAFEIAYLKALMTRNSGNITRSAQEAGITRYHLRELLKRHNLTPR